MPQRQLLDLNSRYRWGSHNLERAILERIGHKKARLELAARALQTVSPLRTLDRGYAIVTLATHGGIVTDSSSVEIGSSIMVRLSRGELIATVNESQPEKNETKKT